jgi:hypothetical protein
MRGLDEEYVIPRLRCRLRLDKSFSHSYEPHPYRWWHCIWLLRHPPPMVVVVWLYIERSKK